MKRAPVVIASTAAGLVGLMSFSSTPAKVSLNTLAPSPTTNPSGPTTTTPSGVRSATGSIVNYYYGTLSVKVRASGRRIINISIASLNDGGSSYSSYVDQQSIPILKQEALAAQSANIQSVSGASYTSQGFDQSLQSALTQLGVQ